MNKKHPDQANRESHLFLSTALFVIWLLFAGLVAWIGHAGETYLEALWSRAGRIMLWPGVLFFFTDQLQNEFAGKSTKSCILRTAVTYSIWLIPGVLTMMAFADPLTLPEFCHGLIFYGLCLAGHSLYLIRHRKRKNKE